MARFAEAHKGVALSPINVVPYFPAMPLVTTDRVYGMPDLALRKIHIFPQGYSPLEKKLPFMSADSDVNVRNIGMIVEVDCTDDVLFVKNPWGHVIELLASPISNRWARSYHQDFILARDT